MMDIASYIKSMVKTDVITIDNLVFRLHYRITVGLLLSASIIGVAKQYFGDPINCQTSSGIESKVLDDYCWIHSTFHIRNSVVMNSNIPPNISSFGKLVHENTG